MINNYVKSTYNKTKIIYKCETHNIKFSSYCTNCKIHLCNQCIYKQSHTNHNIINLNNAQISIGDLSHRILEAHVLLDDYFVKLKEKILNQLNQKIELINAKYEEVKQVNMNILLLIESLVNNYNEDYPNYFIYNNIINNCNLSLSKCEKEDNCDTVIDYFSNFLLNEDNLKQAEYNFREIKTIEIKENITSLFVLNNGKILCCTNGTNIKIFNPNDNYNCKSIIKLNEKKTYKDIYTTKQRTYYN